MARSPNRVLTPSQSTSKQYARHAVPFSKIFVWEAYISNISTNITTCIDGLRFCRDVRNGDYPTKGDEWHTPGML